MFNDNRRPPRAFRELTLSFRGQKKYLLLIQLIFSILQEPRVHTPKKMTQRPHLLWQCTP